MVCDECGRCFRRESDKARHKFLSERRKPVSDQAGSVQCESSLGAKEVWQCAGVGGQRSWNLQCREEQQQPREK